MTPERLNASPRMCHFQTIADAFNEGKLDDNFVHEIKEMKDEDIVALAIECGFEAEKFLKGGV